MRWKGEAACLGWPSGGEVWLRLYSWNTGVETMRRDRSGGVTYGCCRGDLWKCKKCSKQGY